MNFKWPLFLLLVFGLRVAQPLIADNPGRSILKVVGEFGQPSL